MTNLELELFKIWYSDYTEEEFKQEMKILEKELNRHENVESHE